MSRTDDLRGSGAQVRGGGGGEPFVKWGDEYAWLEGRVTGTFTTKFGLAATLKVTETGGAPLLAQGKNEDGERYEESVVSGQSYNVGLASAALDGKITAEDEGKAFHVAFEGWEHPPNGNRYRVFTVIELSERQAPEAQDAWDGPEPEDTQDYGGSGASDDLPFAPFGLPGE